MEQQDHRFILLKSYLRSAIKFDNPSLKRYHAIKFRATGQGQKQIGNVQIGDEDRNDVPPRRMISTQRVH